MEVYITKLSSINVIQLYINCLPEPLDINIVTDIIRYLVIHVVYRLSLTVPSGPPFVSLEVSLESVRGGDNVNVTCTVLGEPDVDVSFSWSYPGQVRRVLGFKPKVKPALG